jgi:hypothetical protein
VEALSINPADAGPDHWRNLHNLLLAGKPSRRYSREQHRAWLQRRPHTGADIRTSKPSRIACSLKATCMLFSMESLLQERLGEEERHPVPDGAEGPENGQCCVVAQVALGGFTAAEAARRLAECGYNELSENDCEDLRASRLYSQTQSY